MREADSGAARGSGGGLGARESRHETEAISIEERGADRRTWSSAWRRDTSMLAMPSADGAGAVTSQHGDLIDQYDGFLIDLDGVVYIGDSAVPGAATAIRTLRRRGKHVLFLTNDPRFSRIDYSWKLRTLSIDAGEDDVVTAAYATARYIQRYEDVGPGRAFVIGSCALKEELQTVGLNVVDVDARAAEFVVVGGHDGFSYADLRTAAWLARNGARFLATGRDPTFPMPDGPWPATGAILAAVETAASTSALVIGKPEPHMFDIARELLHGVDRIAVVGDRLDSDIEGGRRAGLATILIADSTPEGSQGNVIPDVTIPSLASLLGDGGS